MQSIDNIANKRIGYANQGHDTGCDPCRLSAADKNMLSRWWYVNIETIEVVVI